MKIINNINYEKVIKEADDIIKDYNNEINKNKKKILFDIIFSLSVILCSIGFIIFMNYKSRTIEDIILTACLFGGILLFSFIPLRYNYKELSKYKRKLKKDLEILNSKKSLEEKAKIISKKYHLFRTLNIEEHLAELDFLRNCKVKSAVYNTLSQKLQLRYLKDNEIKDKSVNCEIHYFEKLEETELVITNLKIRLHIQENNLMDERELDLLDHFKNINFLF